VRRKPHRATGGPLVAWWPGGQLASHRYKEDLYISEWPPTLAIPPEQSGWSSGKAHDRAWKSRIPPQQLDQIARRAFGCVPPGRQQIERQGHARQEVRREPLRIDERADFAVGSLAPGGMGDFGGEEIAASPARRA
jgi:hypothetical protein